MNVNDKQLIDQVTKAVKTCKPFGLNCTFVEGGVVGVEGSVDDNGEVNGIQWWIPKGDTSAIFKGEKSESTLEDLVVGMFCSIVRHYGPDDEIERLERLLNDKWQEDNQ